MGLIALLNLYPGLPAASGNPGLEYETPLAFDVEDSDGCV